MDKQESKLKELLGDIVQVGIVVDDMNKVKTGMKTIFGLDPSAESDNVYKKNMVQRGFDRRSSKSCLLQSI